MRQPRKLVLTVASFLLALVSLPARFEDEPPIIPAFEEFGIPFLCMYGTEARSRGGVDFALFEDGTVLTCTYPINVPIMYDGPGPAWRRGSITLEQVAQTKATIFASGVVTNHGDNPQTGPFVGFGTRHKITFRVGPDHVQLISYHKGMESQGDSFYFSSTGPLRIEPGTRDQLLALEPQSFVLFRQNWIMMEGIMNGVVELAGSTMEEIDPPSYREMFRAVPTPFVPPTPSPTPAP